MYDGILKCFAEINRFSLLHQNFRLPIKFIDRRRETEFYDFVTSLFWQGRDKTKTHGAWGSMPAGSSW
ncbi:hypothetical protein ElyMa_005315900 [Elysia marginata]|uniref:Uncharacterized protein n=1 Tax=Elysia marginata TaxID=1093978 RepID=A0AAV4JYY9_9GAST|nr:hypothetical protein ElyMa_005315900 [Elysia marginata]